MKNFPKNRDSEIEEMMQIYKTRKEAIRTRLSEFSAVPPSEYFYELVYCLLTPQSSAMHAEQVADQLRKAGFQNQKINPEPFLRKKECYIRFHRVKSRYLIQLKDQFPLILEKIDKSKSAFELRDWLVKNVLGLGLKEATHLLRNIGKNDGLAILDRHILRNLKRLKVIQSIPKSISRKHYLKIEKRFAEFASDIGIVLDELDLVFWSMETGEIRK